MIIIYWEIKYNNKIIKLLIQSLTYTEVMKNKILKLKKIKHY